MTYYDALRRHSRLVCTPGQRIRLLDASAIGYVGMVKHLIENGGDISTTDQDLFTSLHLAAQNGHLSLVKLLLETGADPNAVTKSKETPLNLAAYKGHDEIARLLVDSGADATLADDNMFTPLHSAAQSGLLDLVKLLLEKGADPNAVTKSKETLTDRYIYFETGVWNRFSVISHVQKTDMKLICLPVISLASEFSTSVRSLFKPLIPSFTSLSFPITSHMPLHPHHLNFSAKFPIAAAIHHLFNRSPTRFSILSPSHPNHRLSIQNLICSQYALMKVWLTLR
jgi:hypothetical protein